MRVITFNLRFENDRDGENAWDKRRELVAAVIERYRPDILCTQEGRWDQLTYLQERLPEYEINAPDRVIDDTTQYPTIFCRKDSFLIFGGDEFWLSRTPRIHKSK
ncbi:MAG: endonuclease/exonuclease/phosphatase family protein, partial [Desulfobacteraceae bacterium]